ncbi:hypothetical protein HRI_001543600 [Hibiscus trionum]|uniref:Uncharacterized protein n=1 Tax=Hibiscus trionum TaxID=183268 RepID=A0A9W7HL03_HIBTR|nr:hypothetical protein HRI_001543600 [Hibiscus trionum]
MASPRITISDGPSTSRKRLLSDCAKPQTPLSLGQPPLKKTRELPNLTECQACGSRSDNASSKNQIQTLYSEWRIVLLCPKCYHRVDSSQICSYCFKEASEDCFSCAKCKRSLHKTCFLDYKSVPPWSYSVSGSEFTVCIDCWVPGKIAHKRGILRRERNAKSSRISEVKNGGAAKLLEDVVKDANRAMEETVEAAVKVRRVAVNKAVVAHQVVELEKSDDAELAFRLHRAMNSSPRISKVRNLCNDNSIDTLIAGSSRTLSCLKQTGIVYARRRKKPAEMEPRGIVYAHHRKKPVQMVYARRRKKECEIRNEQCRNKLNEMVYVRRRKKPCKLVYRRRRKQSDSKEKSDVEIGLKGKEDRCSNLLSKSGVDNGTSSESKAYNYQDDSIVFDNMQSDGKLVQYLLTYRRKKPKWKGAPVGKTEFLYDGYNLESQASSSQLPESLMILTNSLQYSAFPQLATAASYSCQDTP